MFAPGNHHSIPNNLKQCQCYLLVTLDLKLKIMIALVQLDMFNINGLVTFLNIHNDEKSSGAPKAWRIQ